MKTYKSDNLSRIFAIRKKKNRETNVLLDGTGTKVTQRKKPFHKNVRRVRSVAFN